MDCRTRLIRYDPYDAIIRNTEPSQLSDPREPSQRIDWLPVEAEILKVAGSPLTTGSGTTSTPLTFTG